MIVRGNSGESLGPDYGIELIDDENNDNHGQPAIASTGNSVEASTPSQAPPQGEIVAATASPGTVSSSPTVVANSPSTTLARGDAMKTPPPYSITASNEQVVQSVNAAEAIVQQPQEHAD
jgi:hypothetical protein